jgi:hypothetical protein
MIAKLLQLSARDTIANTLQKPSLKYLKTLKKLSKNPQKTFIKPLKNNKK